MLAEQVGGDLALIVCNVEQRLVGRDDRPARDPCLTVPATRRAFVLALVKPQPFGLLVWRGECQGADRLAVDLVLGVEFSDRFSE